MEVACFDKRAVPGSRVGGSGLSPQSNEHGDREVCIANISPRERRIRLLAGVIQFVIALAILTALTGTGADRLWRLPLLFLFWGAATGLVQWRDKT